MPHHGLECNGTINETHYHNDTCTTNLFSAAQNDTLSIVVCVFGCLSFLGSSFIVVTFSSFKKLRAPALRLVLYLAITDMVSTVRACYPTAHE